MFFFKYKCCSGRTGGEERKKGTGPFSLNSSKLHIISFLVWSPFKPGCYYGTIPATQEYEAGGLLWVYSQPRLHSEYQAGHGYIARFSPKQMAEDEGKQYFACLPGKRVYVQFSVPPKQTSKLASRKKLSMPSISPQIQMGAMRYSIPWVRGNWGNSIEKDWLLFLDYSSLSLFLPV